MRERQLHGEIPLLCPFRAALPRRLRRDSRLVVNGSNNIGGSVPSAQSCWISVALELEADEQPEVLLLNPQVVRQAS